MHHIISGEPTEFFRVLCLQVELRPATEYTFVFYPGHPFFGGFIFTSVDIVSILYLIGYLAVFYGTSNLNRYKMQNPVHTYTMYE